MSALNKLILLLACFFLLLMPACSEAGTEAEAPSQAATVTAGAVETLEALPPAPVSTATPLAATAAATDQPPASGEDAGPALDVIEETETAAAPTPEPTEEPTPAPSATPAIVVTQTGEAPTPRATVTLPAATDEATEAAPQATEEGEGQAPTLTATPMDEAVTGVVLGNSGTTADLVERGIALDVTGLASTFAWQVVPISDTITDPLPRHILLTFDEDDPEEMVAEAGRRLYLFPVRPYQALYPAEGQSAVDEQVARLGELIDTAQERTSGTDQPPGEWMPLLPLLEDGRLRTWEQFADVDFASGRGVRFVSDESGVPTYYYQGLSEGERYYLSLFWPLVGEGAPSLEALDMLAASFTIGERGES